MARGVGAQILLLALFTLVIVGITIVLLLVLGVADRDKVEMDDEIVLRELDGYVAPGSETIVRGEHARQLLAMVDPASFQNMQLADVTDRTVLEELDITRFDHVMAEYVNEGTTTYATVCEAAMRRNEIAVGYRLAKDARDASAAYGVRVNPPKREKVAFSASDHVIVLAEG